MPLVMSQCLQLIASILQHCTANTAVLLGPSLAIPTTGGVLPSPQHPETFFGAADSHPDALCPLRDGHDTETLLCRWLGTSTNDRLT